MSKGKRLTMKVNFSNRWRYSLVLLGLLIILAGVVYAYNSNPANPAVFGHTLNEFAAPSPCNTSSLLQWNGTQWRCNSP